MDNPPTTPQEASDLLIATIHEQWPSLEVMRPGGLTERYNGDIARVAFGLFLPEDTTPESRFRPDPQGPLATELAAHALQDWSIDFSATRRERTYDKLGKRIHTGIVDYHLRMSVLPPLPENYT